VATHSRSLRSAATPEAIWRVWSDPSTWPSWNPNVEAITLTGPFASGATGTMRNNPGGTHSVRLTSVEPQRGFTLVTSPVPLTTFTFRCDIVPDPAGGATISQSVSMGGPLGPLFGVLMGKRVANSFVALLEGLSQAALAA
jgi:hypothetical protein